MRKPSPEYIAFTEGMKARRDNVALKDNPYPDKNTRIAWDNGWLTEERHLKRQVNNGLH